MVPMTTPRTAAVDCDCGATVKLTDRPGRAFNGMKLCPACGAVVVHHWPSPPCSDTPILVGGLGSVLAGCECGWSSPLLPDDWQNDQAVARSAFAAHREASE